MIPIRVAEYDLRVAGDLEEALRCLEDGCRPFAGGTDLMVELAAGTLQPRRFVGLWRLRELRGIGADEERVTLGALATYSEIRADPLLQEEFPLLADAAARTGAVATQNRGTIGGNIANASPAGAACPPLLVYDAELELIGPHGARRVDYCNFHRGYKEMDLAPNELIARILLPRNKRGWRQMYRKVGPRAAQSISKVAFAAAARVHDGRIEDIRIAVGSVAPVPLRCVRTEERLRGARLNALRDVELEEIAPVDDVRSTAKYRRAVSNNLLRQFLASLTAIPEPGGKPQY